MAAQSSHSDPSDHSDRPDAPQEPVKKPNPAPPCDPLRRWRDAVEERLAEARERGDFDNLPGAGKPLALDRNPFAGDKSLAYSLLKNNHLAPPEIERGKEIDADLARADALLAALRRRRDALPLRTGGAYAAQRRAYNLQRDKTEAHYAEMLRTANSNILSLNIVAPAALHRRPLDLERLLGAFRDEFPRLQG